METKSCQLLPLQAHVESYCYPYGSMNIDIRVSESHPPVGYLKLMQHLNDHMNKI
jgi:hypothetical protein